jgi:rubrerythrin
MLESRAIAMPAEPTLPLSDLSLPRRVAVAELLGEIVATERALAELYEGFAAGTSHLPLQAALKTLVREKRARLERLEPLARAAGADGGADGLAPPQPTEDTPVERRADFFARAFQGERILEVRVRELAMLIGDAGVPAALAELAAENARHLGRLRELYLRYS